MKDFDGPALERRLNEPRTPASDREFIVAGETLVYSQSVPAAAIIGLGLALRSGDEMRAARATTDAIMALLDPVCHDAFIAAVDKLFPDYTPGTETYDTATGEVTGGEPHPLAGEFVVDTEQLGDMYRWLMSTVSSRPPTKRSTSPRPSTPNGTPLTPESPLPEPTAQTSTSGAS